MGQAPSPSGELERLRKENQQLRKQLSDAQEKSRPEKAVAKPEDVTVDKKVISEVATVPESRGPSTFLDKMFLRKSVFDQDLLAPGQITGPAQITYVHPGHGNDTYAVDAGLAFTFITPQPGLWQIDWALGADYHRNSDISAKKDLFQTGVIADAIFGNPAEGDFVRMKGNLSYKDNAVMDLRSVSGGIDVLPVVAGLWIDNYHRLGPAHWRWQPFAGFRYESTTDTAVTAKNGHRLLALYGVETQIFPLFDYVKRTVEVKTTYTMWSDVSSSGVYSGKSWNGFLDADLTYWFNGGLSVHKQKIDLGVGITYQNGDNPELSLTHVDLLTVALKAKF